MALRISKAHAPLIILSFAAIPISLNLWVFSHLFLHAELHPLDPKHLFIGVTTALLTTILITSLFVLTRDPSKDRPAEEFDLSTFVETNSFFRLLAEKSSDMIHFNDHTGVILYANPVTSDLLGYDPREIIHKSAENFIHPEDWHKVREDMHQVALGIAIPPRQVRLLKKNDETLEVEIKGFALDIGGEKKYIGAILRDISRRKKNELLLQAQKEWEQTFNTMTDFVSVHDKQFTIIKANHSLCELLGKKPEDIVGRRCHQLFHDRDSPYDGCPHQKAGQTGHPVSEIIDDPHIGVPLQITCSPLLDSAGEFQGSVHIARVINPAERHFRHRKRMIPVCASCKDIREESGIWTKIELFFMKKFDVQFTHSLCQDCQQKLYSEYIKP